LDCIQLGIQMAQPPKEWFETVRLEEFCLAAVLSNRNYEQSLQQSGKTACDSDSRSMRSRFVPKLNTKKDSNMQKRKLGKSNLEVSHRAGLHGHEFFLRFGPRTNRKMTACCGPPWNAASRSSIPPKSMPVHKRGTCRRSTARSQAGGDRHQIRVDLSGSDTRPGARA